VFAITFLKMCHRFTNRMQIGDPNLEPHQTGGYQISIGVPEHRQLLGSNRREFGEFGYIRNCSLSYLLLLISGKLTAISALGPVRTMCYHAALS
jgi:hypothetical protein